MNEINADAIMALKELPYGAIALETEFDGKAVRMILLTRECIENNHIVHLLSTWRKANEFWSQAIFPISDSRTKIWLKEKVIEEKERLLFMVEIDDHFIGHLGLWRFDFERHSCEIDNVMRGKSGHSWPWM